MKKSIGFLICIVLLINCKNNTSKNQKTELNDSLSTKTDIYKSVILTTDITKLNEEEKQIIPLLIKAAAYMDTIYWLQVFGKKDSFLANIKDENLRRFAQINYGPWDRLNDDKPFISGYNTKPLGANFYPSDIQKTEIEKSKIKDILSQYSIVKRNEKNELFTVPYHIVYKVYLEKASALLVQAANITTDLSFKKYLNLRAKALLNDNFTASDIAWLDMKTNHLDIIIGPIENYEDKLYNARTSYEAYVLVKDLDWSKKLEKYVSFLPELQKGLPVDIQFKTESPGTESQLNAYDAIFYAGDCNAGSKTIAVNLPNDEKLQNTKGTRRSQLKNVMKAKFDHILIPISNELISDDQIKHVTFNAFFSNTMFHEVAHGLGIKNTINKKGFVRTALGELHSALEEGKADILGLYMIDYLYKKGELKESELLDYYVTFLASILRSVRFGAASAHGQANMLRFNFFKQEGAFSIDKNGKYKVEIDKMTNAMNQLSKIILTLQGNGDKAGVEKLMKEMGGIGSDLQKDLDKLTKKNIPVDIIFKQGIDILKLN